MHQASVGFQCPECVKQGARTAPVYTARTLPSEQTWATFLLIAINVGVFVWDLTTGGTISEGQGAAYRNGVMRADLIAYGEWYRLVSAGFLHFGVIHLGLNMLALYVLGPQLERLLGPARFLTLYFAALLAGSLGALLVTPNALSAGASGAIFGLFGAALAYQLSNKINIWTSGLGGLILINLVFTFTFPGISKGAHLGGMIGGTIVGYAMFELERRRQSPWLGVAVACALGVACLAASIALAPQLAVYR